MSEPEVGRRHSFDTIIPAVSEHTSYMVVMANLRDGILDRLGSI